MPARLGAVLCVALAMTPALGRDLGCRGNPHLIGKCYMVRGSSGISADMADTLVRDSDGKWLIVRAAPHSTRSIPDNALSAMDLAQRRTGFVSIRLNGLYQVCPIPPEEPRHEYVCIESARHLSVDHRR